MNKLDELHEELCQIMYKELHLNMRDVRFAISLVETSPWFESRQIDALAEAWSKGYDDGSFGDGYEVNPYRETPR